jgi:hypothetical protein
MYPVAAPRKPMNVDLLHSEVHRTHIHDYQDPPWRTAHRDEADEKGQIC